MRRPIPPDQPVYNKIEPKETQPLANDRKRNSRRYIGATWAPPGEGEGHPKLSGGYEVDGRGIATPARGFNRPDQRYTGVPADLVTKRYNRALLEIGGTAIYGTSDGRVGIRTVTGNQYKVAADFGACDCPDAWRLLQSFPEDDIPCKHRCMAVIAVGSGTVDDLPWSTKKVAQAIGCEPRTIEQILAKGGYTAYKTNGVWMLDAAEAASLIADFTARIVDPDREF